MSIASGGKAVSRPRKSVNPSPWMLRRVIRPARRLAKSRALPLRRLNALAATGAALLTVAGRIFSLPLRASPADASDWRVSRRARMASDRAIPASAPAVASTPAQNALPMNSADDGNDRQEEADRYAGEAGQDEEDRFCDDIGCAAADGDGAKAGVPEKREGGDCRGDPNERSPYFTASQPQHRRANDMAPAQRARLAGFNPGGRGLPAGVGEAETTASLRRRAATRFRPKACPAS